VHGGCAALTPGGPGALRPPRVVHGLRTEPDGGQPALPRVPFPGVCMQAGGLPVGMAAKAQTAARACIHRTGALYMLPAVLCCAVLCCALMLHAMLCCAESIPSSTCLPCATLPAGGLLHPSVRLEGQLLVLQCQAALQVQISTGISRQRFKACAAKENRQPLNSGLPVAASQQTQKEASELPGAAAEPAGAGCQQRFISGGRGPDSGSLWASGLGPAGTMKRQPFALIHELFGGHGHSWQVV